MTGKDVELLLKKYNVTIGKFAVFLGVNYGTVFDWIKKDASIKQIYQRRINLFIEMENRKLDIEKEYL